MPVDPKISAQMTGAFSSTATNAWRGPIKAPNGELSMELGSYAKPANISDGWNKIFPGTGPESFLACFNFGAANSADLRMVFDRHIFEFDLKVYRNGAEVLTTDPEARDTGYGISMDALHKTIKVDKVRVTNEDIRHSRALGKQFIASIAKLAILTDMKEILLRTGLEDGAVFWSRMGFSLEDKYAYEGFLRDLRQSLEREELNIPADLKERILGRFFNDDGSENWMLNVEIAYMDGGQEDYREAIFRLLKDVGEMRVRISMDNEPQMAVLRDALGRSGVTVPNRIPQTAPLPHPGE